MLRISAFILILSFHVNSFSQNKIGTTEALLIREAKIISDKTGENIWPGISKTPFTIILITDSIEYLIFHPIPSGDFKFAYRDSILQADVYSRTRIYSKNWLATFPAVGGVNCIVVGTPKNTNRSLTNWMITLLHEHFHQYVNSWPGYFVSVNKLDLSGGDETGMWMLNYPFPYDSTVIVEQYEKYTKVLINAVEAVGKKEFTAKLSLFIKEKEKFKALLKPADYRYFSFQLWQEGLASYTEYKFLQVLASHRISPELTELSGFTSLPDYRDAFFKHKMKDLHELKLTQDKRICIYAVGFAEGILLDIVNKNWRKQYFTDKFGTDNYFKK